MVEFAKEQKQIILNTFKEGLWVFPSMRFYEKCIATGISIIDSSFAEKKAYNIAKQIMLDEDVPENCHALYISSEKVLEYFEEGKRKKLEKEQAEENERNTPKRGSLKNEELLNMHLANETATLYGTDKRLLMIDKTLARIRERINDYIEGQKALASLSYHISVSAKQEPTKDWAFLGGLAEGIAGAGAGVAVAANAMQANRAIEHRNLLAREAAMQTAREFSDSALNLSTNIDNLKNQEKLMMYHRDDATTKMIFDDYSTEDIFSKLSFSTNVDKTKSGTGLKLMLEVTNNFKIETPEWLHVAVDGTLSADIYSGDTHVSTINVCLPLFGVATKEMVVAYSESYIEAEVEYTVEIKPNTLWITEV